MEIRQQFRVSMSDVDAAFIFFGAYIQWMERGFQLYVKECGRTFSELMLKGFIFPVVNIDIQYFSPARLDDDVEVVTKIDSFGNSSITVSHRFYRMFDQKLLAEGKVKHVYTSSTDMKSKPLPEWIIPFGS